MIENAVNIIIAALMGIAGGLITLPFNAAISWFLKRDEIQFQKKWEWVVKKRELLWMHELQISDAGKYFEDIQRLNGSISRIDERMYTLEKSIIAELQNSVYNANEHISQYAIVTNNIKNQIFELETRHKDDIAQLTKVVHNSNGGKS